MEWTVADAAMPSTLQVSESCFSVRTVPPASTMPIADPAQNPSR